MLDQTKNLLPRLPPHRPSAAARAAYQEKVGAFCAKLLEVRSGLDFDVGSRGWAYVLEGERLIDKDDIDAAQDLINACRKSGDLRSISAPRTTSALSRMSRPSTSSRRTRRPPSSTTCGRRRKTIRRSASGMISTSSSRLALRNPISKICSLKPALSCTCRSPAWAVGPTSMSAPASCGVSRRGRQRASNACCPARTKKARRLASDGQCQS